MNSDPKFHPLDNSITETLMNHEGALYKHQDCQVMRMPSRIWNLKKKGWFEDGTDHPIQMADAFESIHHHRPRTYMRKPTTSKQKNTARPPFENSKIILLTPKGWKKETEVQTVSSLTTIVFAMILLRR